jgi:polar amino acid transport system substrate-binding protein
MGTPAQAEDIKVMFGVSRPPYIMQKEHAGIVFELAETIFVRMGLSFRPSFASIKRMERELLAGNIDVAVEVRPTNPEIFYSDAFMMYRNFAVSRKSDKITRTTFSDLRGRSVCAWQGASAHVGEPLERAITEFSSYREFPLQEQQVGTWLAKLCDVILIDDTLLKWHVKQLVENFRSNRRNVDLALDFHPFPGNNEIWFHVGFRDRTLRDRFNQILAEIREDGTFESIRERYISRN